MLIQTRYFTLKFELGSPRDVIEVDRGALIRAADTATMLKGAVVDLNDFPSHDNKESNKCRAILNSLEWLDAWMRGRVVNTPSVASLMFHGGIRVSRNPGHEQEPEVVKYPRWDASDGGNPQTHKVCL